VEEVEGLASADLAADGVEERLYQPARLSALGYG